MRQGGNTYGHVVAGAGEGTGHRSDQFTRHSEVAKFDNSFTGQENVRGFYIPVNYLFRV